MWTCSNILKHGKRSIRSVPVLSFAKWYIYTALGMQEQADALLSLYPDNVLMNYLRIKSTLNGDEDLIKQLNLIFENNANFVENENIGA